MITMEITYEARCKHCINCSTKKNKGRYQAFCLIKEEFIRLKDKACKDFKL